MQSDGSLGGIYRKMHIPDDPLYYEKFYFTPGDLGFKAFDTSVGQVGALICWDQWYPEAARITALRGANLLFYPTAIGWHPAEKEAFGTAQYDAWQTIQRAHAIANGVYVASVNRVGHEYGDIRGNRAPGVGLEFWGGSFIADPFGRILAQAPHDSEAILIEEVDLKHLEDTRRNWPFLRDRRIDSYPPITARFLDEPAEWQLTPEPLAAWVIACRQSGSRMPQPGWHGPTTRPTGRVRFHPIPWVYCDIVRHLSRVEDVHLLVQDGVAEQRARSMLARTGAQLDRVHFHQWPTNRVWMRDSGPIFVTRARRRKTPSPSPTGASMPGPSTRTGSLTTSFPSRRRNCSTSPVGRRNSPAAIAWSWKAAVST